ncbi:hypothetical protein H2199_005262 [Coniosporium tulheliwenetii]|uniref:Uncharacterized protein n=1 Tax=Coniosporium tulheliwenetii TaxID=3383036 RepID=A0ACC2Z3W7_9PEZI|nr:hypothetical protein H2199_005262 [Cladosporium sp. JES 115]
MAPTVARLLPLTAPFLSYLRADGIVLPPDPSDQDWSDSDSGVFSSTDNTSDSSDDEDDDPSAQWREIHQSIKDIIEELGGKVMPKLNWSAPKDATWINATNSMECRTPNDVYLLLKSSDFVTHDLEHAFDDCEDDTSKTATSFSDVEAQDDDRDTKARSQTLNDIPYHLILRKSFQLNPSLEFRCFVRKRRLIALCQRDLNHFDFLFSLRSHLTSKIHEFFDVRLRDTFPDEDFVFDVYVPPPHEKVWLVDINPWAQRTDPLLFSWLELLEMPAPGEDDGSDTETEEEEADEEMFVPELRLVRKDDPEAYGFSTPQYSAHKLPRDVVDASRGGESGLREFAEQWKEVLARRQREEEGRRARMTREDFWQT